MDKPYIPQRQLRNLKRLICPNKVIVLYGPRRCGKTTLINKYIGEYRDKYLLVSGDDITVKKYLGSRSISRLKDFVGHNRLLVIDEAQYIENIGLNLKLIIDHINGIEVIATGSSSFDLAKNIGEPLTGRKFVLTLFPPAQCEISAMESRSETDANLDARLIYGSYPEIVVTRDNRQRKIYLRELVSSYLYKDILELEGIRHSNKLIHLLQLLAFQIGKEVSHNELGTRLGMSKNTVERYLDLLEKAFVLYKLSGFSRNLRKEISKNNRYYFYDNGVRNALIENFNPIDMRDDIGMLWENYIVMERLKARVYGEIFSNSYFWRTYDRKEIDLVEERGGRLYGYEIKWRKKRVKPPGEWLTTYKNSEFHVIHRENYLDFISCPG